jgi:beta-carotene ketolase (CrtO type)
MNPARYGDSHYDAVVIGGGHSGLTCAAYLARAEKRVVVLEANSYVGGFCITGELLPGAPGFKVSPYALDFMTAPIEPSVITELGLARYGLRFVHPDPYAAYLSPEGSSWSVWYSLDRTCESIARLSRRDAAYYRSLVEPMIDFIHMVIPYLQDHPTRPRPATLLKLALRAARSRKSLSPAVRTLMSSPIEIIDGFEREELKAFFAVNCTGALMPLEEGANGSMFAHLALMHRWRLHRPVGGSGMFSEALASYVRDHGGEVRTSAPVQEVITERGRATGVVVAGGDVLTAEHVIGAVDPVTLMNKLLPANAVAPEVRDEIDRIQVLRYGIHPFKGDLAFSRRPRFPHHDLPEHHFSALFLSPTLEYTQAALEANLRGELGDTHPIYFSMPSIHDRSLVPPGSDGDVGFIYALTPPIELADGRAWKEVKDGYLDRCLDHLELYSPGIKDTIVDSVARPVTEFNNPWAHKGAIWGVDVSPTQMGPWRPTPAMSGFRTPIDHLWHTGPGAHPLPGVCGWGGRTTARWVLRDLPGRTRPRALDAVLAGRK